MMASLRDGKSNFLVLNRPVPVTSADVCMEDVTELNVDTGYLRKGEITSALKTLRNNKATGTDDIAAEVLKADSDFTASELERYRTAKRFLPNGNLASL